MALVRLIGIFGGTFDPIHLGHLQSVNSLRDELPFECIYLLPSFTPPHRSPAHSDSRHRLKMVQLAITGRPGLDAGARECNRPGKSWTIDTLESYRDEYPDHTLAFIAGMDAYADMPNWKRGDEFLEFAHIVVLRRPGFPPEKSWGHDHVAHEAAELLRVQQGLVYFANSAERDMSATTIRKRLENHEDVSEFLTRPVINYINLNQLYATGNTTERTYYQSA